MRNTKNRGWLQSLEISALCPGSLQRENHTWINYFPLNNWTVLFPIGFESDVCFLILMYAFWIWCMQNLSIWICNNENWFFILWPVIPRRPEHWGGGGGGPHFTDWRWMFKFYRLLHMKQIHAHFTYMLIDVLAQIFYLAREAYHARRNLSHYSR